MLYFASRRCWAVLTAGLPSRSFALVAGRPINAEELQHLVDEARRRRRPGPRPRQAPPCSRLGDEALAASDELDYRTILRYKVQKLVSDARHRSKQRGMPFDLDWDFLFDFILEQQGMCAYSGVHMELVGPRADWLMSLERLDNQLGYLPHNVALISQEFNSMVRISKNAVLQGSSQWSKQKVEQLRPVRGMNVDLENLRRQIDLAAGSENVCGNKGKFCTEDALGAEPGTLKCSICGIWQPLCQFASNWRTTRNFSCLCKKCRGEYTRTKDMKTLRGAVWKMIANARGRHNLGRWQGDFELELDDVLGMLWAQQGRCFYSGVPLRYGETNVDWLMSLERLDNTKTYTKANTCLVALEFNTVNQWSIEKVQLVWGNMLGDEDTPDFPKFPPGFPSSFHLPVPEDVPIDVPSIAWSASFTHGSGNVSLERRGAKFPWKFPRSSRSVPMPASHCQCKSVLFVQHDINCWNLMSGGLCIIRVHQHCFSMTCGTGVAFAPNPSGVAFAPNWSGGRGECDPGLGANVTPAFVWQAQ